MPIARFFVPWVLVSIALTGCRLGQDKAIREFNSYRAQLSPDESARTLSMLEAHGYNVGRSPAVRVEAFLGEELVEPVVQLDISNPVSQESKPLDFALHNKMRGLVAMERERTVLLCVYDFFLSTKQKYLHRMLLFGSFVHHHGRLGERTRVRMFSELFVSESQPNQREIMGKCRELRRGRVLSRALAVYRDLATNLFYPVPNQPCRERQRGMVGARSCRGWYSLFARHIQKRALPVCHLVDRDGGLCELRSRSDNIAAAFRHPDGAVSKVPTANSHLLQGAGIRFLCNEVNPYFTLRRVSAMHQTNQRYQCVVKP